MVEGSREARLRRLAGRLAAAWNSGGQIGQVESEDLPRDRVEAYFVQDRMAAEIGDDVVGWKVGATSARMREIDGHEDVVPGCLLRSTTWQGSRFSVPAGKTGSVRVEAEFGFRMLADVPLRQDPWTPDELGSIAVLRPAVEIIGTRHELPDMPARTRSLMTVADNGGGIGFVFGEEIGDWRGLELRTWPVELSVDGGRPAEVFPSEMRADPAAALAELVAHLAARGIELAAGDFVSTGSACVPQPTGPGGRVVTDFGSLGRIELDFER